MNKRTVLGILGTVLVGVLATAGAQPTTTTSAPAKKVVLRLAHSFDLPHIAFIEKWMATVKAKSGGRIEFQYFPNGQLVGAAQMWDELQAGRIDISSMASGSFTGKAPLLGLYSLQYVFASFPHAGRAYDAGLAKFMNDNVYEPNGMHFLTTSPSAWMTWFTAKKAAQVPSDLKGLKVRVAGEADAKLAQAVGGSPVTMTSAEVYSAMKSGVIDGVFTSYATMDSRKLYEVAKYGVISNASMNPLDFVMNLKRWNSLPPDLQQLLATTANDIVFKEYIASLDAAIEVSKANLAKRGMALYQPTDAQLALWRTAAERVTDWWLAQPGVGEKGRKMLDIIKSTRN